MVKSIFRFFLCLIALGLMVFYGLTSSSFAQNGERIELRVIYPPEFRDLMEGADGQIGVIEKFEELYPQYQIIGKAVTSGQVLDAFLDAAPDGDLDEPRNQGNLFDDATPFTVWIPAASYWLILGNHLAQNSAGDSGLSFFDLSDGKGASIARTALVIAVWKNRLQEIAITNGKTPSEVNFQDLIEVAQSGWQDGSDVRIGRTDPFFSTTGISVSMLEIYACTQMTDNNAPLTLADTLRTRVRLDGVINNPALQVCLDELRSASVRYDTTTQIVRSVIRSGEITFDMAPMSEDDFLLISDQLEGVILPEDDELIAVYPAEGTFWHDYPFAIPNGNAAWVTAEQRSGATLLRDFMYSRNVQEMLLANRFRPVDSSVDILAFNSPYDDDFQQDPGFEQWNSRGVIPTEPPSVFNGTQTIAADFPEPEVLNSVQLEYCYVKDRSQILLVIDASESMVTSRNPAPLIGAIAAVREFFDEAIANDYIGLLIFSAEPLTPDFYIPANRPFRDARSDLETMINRLEQSFSVNDRSQGLFEQTALYDSLLFSLQQLSPSLASGEDFKRSIVLLSDGEDEVSQVDARTNLIIELERLTQTSGSLTKVYAVDYDTNPNEIRPSLVRIAEVSSGQAYQGNSTEELARLFRNLIVLVSTSSRCPNASDGG